MCIYIYMQKEIQSKPGTNDIGKPQGVSGNGRKEIQEMRDPFLSMPFHTALTLRTTVIMFHMPSK